MSKELKIRTRSSQVKLWKHRFFFKLVSTNNYSYSFIYVQVYMITHAHYMVYCNIYSIRVHFRSPKVPEGNYGFPSLLGWMPCLTSFKWICNHYYWLLFKHHVRPESLGSSVWTKKVENETWDPKTNRCRDFLLGTAVELWHLFWQTPCVILRWTNIPALALKW